MQNVRYLSYSRPSGRINALISTLCLALATCAAAAPGTYIGNLVPITGACDPPSRSVLIRHGSTVQFLPEDGVLILNGSIAPDGLISAAQQTRNINNVPARLYLTARLTRDHVDGIFTTPSCRYTVTLDAALR